MNSIIIDHTQLDPRFVLYILSDQIYLCFVCFFMVKTPDMHFVHLVQTFCGVLYAAMKYTKIDK